MPIINVNENTRKKVDAWVEALNQHETIEADNLRELHTMEDLYATNYCLYQPQFEGYGRVNGAIEHLGHTHMLNQGHIMVWWDGSGLFVLRGWGKSASGQSICTVRFFAFGCKHEMQHTANLGNCDNEYTCKKCGFVSRIDSSD